MTDRDAAREQLAAALRERLPRGTYNPAFETDADDIADALLPVVDRIANERAAAELRAVADIVDRSITGGTASTQLRHHAAALERGLTTDRATDLRDPAS